MILLLGDVHLRGQAGAQAGEDLARLLRARPDAHVVLTGDVFDLAFEGDGPLSDRLEAIASGHTGAIQAMREHASNGGQVSWVVGNHDYEIASAAGRAWVEDRLGAVELRPWFVRLGDLHVEHGHQWDPDNAHADPVAPDRDPLGVLLARRFVSRLRDLHFMGEIERTPLDLFARTVARYGLRAPGIVVRYFATAFGAVAEAGPAHRPARTDDLRALYPAPTLASRTATLHRLYFDRVAVSLGVALATGLAVAGVVPALVLPAALLFALAVVFFGSPNRFAGSVEARLAAGAHTIARETDARIVVMGHAHRTAEGPVYWNPGSFGLPGRGKPRTYIEIADGVPRLRSMPVGGQPQAEDRESGLSLTG